MANIGSERNSEDFVSCTGGSEFVSMPDSDNLLGSVGKSNQSIVDSVQDILRRCSQESLHQVGLDDLFELHRLSTSLQSQVMTAIKMRCRSDDEQS